MSFTPAHPPQLIFVGVTDRLWKKHNQKGARPGMNWLRLLGFAPVCSPFPRRFYRRRESILPWALPLAGLWTHRRAFEQARPRSNHQPPETPTALGHRPLLSAHGLCAILPVRHEAMFASRRAARQIAHRSDAECGDAAPRLANPSAFYEADALPVHTSRARMDRLPV